MAEQLQAASKLLKKVDPDEIREQRASMSRESASVRDSVNSSMTTDNRFSSTTSSVDKNDRIMALTAQLHVALNQKKKVQRDDDSDDDWDSSSGSDVD